MSTHHLRDTTDVALYSRDRQADIIHAAKDYGASIRQLSRLTGISVGIIRNMWQIYTSFLPLCSHNGIGTAI